MAEEDGHTTTPYPWQQATWQRLLGVMAAEQLPHALLLVGPQGIGKGRLAHSLVARYLCEEPVAGAGACGRCRGCRLLAAGNHPDSLTISPDPQRKTDSLGIDAVREATAFLQFTPHYGQGRCVVVAPADRLTENAANSLLKTLEEPPPGALLILAARRLAPLPATIVSRCRQHALPPVGAERPEVFEWLRQNLPKGVAPAAALALAGGAPERAVAEAGPDTIKLRRERFEEWLALGRGRGDPVKLAESWQKAALLLVESSIGWVEDLLRLKAGGPGEGLRNSDLAEALAELAPSLPERELLVHRERLVQTWNNLQRGSLNAGMALEDCLIDWYDMALKSARNSNNKR